MTGGAPALILRGLLLVIAGTVAGALWFTALRTPAPAPGYFAPAGPVTTIQAVTLTSGQVFFGTLRQTAASGIVLAEVFEGQPVIDPQTKERATRLVARRTANWHAPVDMAIPLDKILFTESIGRDSLVAKEIARITAATASGTK